MLLATWISAQVDEPCGTQPTEKSEGAEQDRGELEMTMLFLCTKTIALHLHGSFSAPHPPIPTVSIVLRFLL